MVQTLCNAMGFTEEPTLYFVLSCSGKPVYFSQGRESEIASYMGVIHTIVSCFDHKDGLLEQFQAKESLFVVYQRSCLIAIGIDKLGKSETQLRNHLELLVNQILSTLTGSQLEKAFRLRPNLDLRAMIGGTEKFLTALVHDFELCVPWSWTGALESLDLPRNTRSDLNSALLDSRSPNLLYGLIVADGRFSSVVRPRKHSLHPPDLHLVFSMLFNTNAFEEGEHWVPICLPRFNPNGFLYAYINFIAPSIALVLISPDRMGFFDMKQMHRRVMERLDLAPLKESLNNGRVATTDIKGAAAIEYFVYKSRTNVQFIQSHSTPEAERTLLRFAQLQAFMNKHQLRICYENSTDKTLLGWHTPAFELYCISATDDKDELSSAVKRLIAWIRKRESRLFIVDGAMF